MIRIPSVRFRQANSTLFIGSMTASDLCKIGVVDTWEPENGWDINAQGYQRKSYDDHSRAIGRFLASNPNALLPTSILLSARTTERGVLNFEVHGGDEFTEHPFGYLLVPESHSLYVVDGQHRMQGFIHAINELKKEVLSDYLLPVVVLCDTDKIQELCQFHLINNRQKRIATNLALALLGTVVVDQPHVAEMLLGHRNVWKLRAIAVAIALNEGTQPGSVWAKRLSLPNEPKGPTVVATLASFVKSLKPFLSPRYPHKLDDAQLEDYLIRFWGALHAILPGAFQLPKDYVVQKTTGVSSLNRVAAELARQKSQVLHASPQQIEPFLRAAKEHLVDAKWKRGGEYAKDYRGDARFRDLADEILVAMGLESSRPRTL